MEDKKVCMNCKYFKVDIIAFDYPQSICDRIKGVIEPYFKCNKFKEKGNKECKKNIKTSGKAETL